MASQWTRLGRLELWINVVFSNVVNLVLLLSGDYCYNGPYSCFVPSMTGLDALSIEFKCKCDKPNVINLQFWRLDTSSAKVGEEFIIGLSSQRKGDGLSMHLHGRERHQRTLSLQNPWRSQETRMFLSVFRANIEQHR